MEAKQSRVLDTLQQFFTITIDSSGLNIIQALLEVDAKRISI